MNEQLIKDIKLAVKQLTRTNTAETAEALVNEASIHPDIVNAIADGIADGLAAKSVDRIFG